MHNPTNYRIQRLSEQGRKAANARWTKDREYRARLDRLDLIQVGGKIVRRIIVIDNEMQVKERAFFEFDRLCDWRRKKRELSL